MNFRNEEKTNMYLNRQDVEWFKILFNLVGHERNEFRSLINGQECSSTQDFDVGAGDHKGCCSPAYFAKGALF